MEHCKLMLVPMMFFRDGSKKDFIFSRYLSFFMSTNVQIFGAQDCADRAWMRAVSASAMKPRTMTAYSCCVSVRFSKTYLNTNTTLLLNTRITVEVFTARRQSSRLPVAARRLGLRLPQHDVCEWRVGHPSSLRFTARSRVGRKSWWAHFALSQP